MKFVAAFLLSLVAAVSGTGTPGDCTACEKIVRWKLYTSGRPVPSPDDQEDPGFFSVIHNGTEVCASRTDRLNWNIMMYSLPTLKEKPCCGDTDNVPRDFINLCGVIRLFQYDNATTTYVPRGPELTEIYWPWFLNGDDPCAPGAYPATCDPSTRIWPSTPQRVGGSGPLPVGSYMLVGSTHNGCPQRPSQQGLPPSGPALDTSVVTFTVIPGC